jgi:hypothetical protein
MKPHTKHMTIALIVAAIALVIASVAAHTTVI